MPLDHAVDPLADERDELRRLERAGAAFLPEDPAGQVADVGVGGREDAVHDASAVDHALDPPRGVGVQLDRGLAGDVAELPLLLSAVLGGLEVLRHAEVALAPRGEANVPANA